MIFTGYRKNERQSTQNGYVMGFRKEYSSSKVYYSNRGMYDRVVTSVRTSTGITSEFPITITCIKGQIYVHVSFHQLSMNLITFINFQNKGSSLVLVLLKWGPPSSKGGLHTLLPFNIDTGSTIKIISEFLLILNQNSCKDAKNSVT